MDVKESHKDSGARKDASAAITQALATAVSDASAISQEAKPEFLPDVESNPAPAPMPIAAQHASNQPSLNAQSAESARAAQDSPRAAPENTFDQIVLGLRTKMDAANQKANIELNPPNLGKLHVSVELSNGILTAQFRTSTDVVRDLLSANMDRLRSVLEGQGIAVDKLAVSAGGATSEQNPQANTSTNQNAGHDGRSGGAFANDRHGPRQSSGEAFSKMWRAALEKEEPIDLLA
jgi:flagellar hook-length control protein FliK